jgi:threonine/homoserine/homoserine lactone efflux protein
MPTLPTLALYIPIAMIVLIIPGPAVLYVVSQGIRHGRRAGVTAIPMQIAMFGLVFVQLGLCADGTFALLAGFVGPRLRRGTRFLRGERYVVGGTFIDLGVVAA